MFFENKFSNIDDCKTIGKPFFSENLQNSTFGIFNIHDLLQILHNILFIYEGEFRKKLDFKDNTISLSFFGAENLFKKHKKFSFVEPTEKNLSFLENLSLNSFYYEKQKKIVYYVMKSMIFPENSQMKNAITLILSINEDEAVYLLKTFLKKYKLLYQDVCFINEHSLEKILNDLHIFDISEHLIRHFLQLIFKNSNDNDKKIINNIENFDEFLKKTLDHQTQKIFDLKKHNFYKLGGQTISVLVLRYCSLKKDSSFLSNMMPYINKLMKKHEIINICLALNLIHLVKEILIL